MATVYYKLIKAKVKTIDQVPDTGTLKADVLALLAAEGLDGNGDLIVTEPV